MKKALLGVFVSLLRCCCKILQVLNKPLGYPLFLCTFIKQQREEIHCSYFFSFSTVRAQNLYLSEGVHRVGIDRQPHEPRQLRLPQIKMGFSSFKSLFTLKTAFQAQALRMTCLGGVFCHQPTRHWTFMTHRIVYTS